MRKIIEPLKMKDTARAEFDGWAHKYDRSILQRFLFKPSHDLIMSEIDSGRHVRILDIGCGTCVFAFRMASQFPYSSIFCMDLSCEMVGKAKKKLDLAVTAGGAGTVKIKIADSEHLPYASNSFDYITCSNSFHHYPRQERVAREMHRVLKPGGRALIVDGFKDNIVGRFIYDGIVEWLEGDVRHLNSGDFKELFGKAGFSPVKHRNNFKGLPIMMVVATAKK
ncbi:MAG TPA: class I SAM-dependent methyltransferase [bacterium]|nr:class I SAM-dependent methyltransferase [bacterium]